MSKQTLKAMDYNFIYNLMIQDQSFNKKQKTKGLGLIKYPTIRNSVSYRDARQQSKKPFSSQNSTNKIPQVITYKYLDRSYLLMRQKIDHFYKKTETLNTNLQHSIHKADKKMSIQSHNPDSESPTKIIHFAKSTSISPQVCKIKTSNLYTRKYQSQIRNKQPENLQINNLHQSEEDKEKDLHELKSSASNAYIQVQFMRRSKYRKKMLDPIKKAKMSNNIKDYLNVEKIPLKEMEQSVLDQKNKMMKNLNANNSNLLGMMRADPDFDLAENRSIKSLKVPDSPTKRSVVTKFKPPFELYNYRDFIWKVGFSNHFQPELVEEYDTKIKYFVGPGNNSNLIKGILKRRPWFQLTDKIQDASFVWTQIKNQSIIISQKKCSETEYEMTPRMIFNESNDFSKNKDFNNKFCFLNEQEYQKYTQYWKLHIDRQRKTNACFKGRNAYFKVKQVAMNKVRGQVKIHNHFTNNYMIGNKKALFKTMSQYYQLSNEDVFQFLPLTFHIKNGIEDDQYLKFLQNYYSINKQNKSNPHSINKFNAWIVKPGENTNRGNGIIVCLDLQEIKTILKKKEKHNDGTYKTYIVQKYIEKPLLYRRRKFDLRHYIMLNCSNGIMKGYWYREGYVRTTSAEYTLKFSNGGVHLTNDAVQKFLPDYGKFEKGNKIFYEELDTYMKKTRPGFDFWKLIYPKMKKISTDVINACAKNIDPERRLNSFQIFGLDFMIDEHYNVFLIEVNTNPCLETACPVLNKVIPRFIENTFQICLDPVFKAPLSFQSKYDQYNANISDSNNFELVFDERIDDVKIVGEVVLTKDMEEEDDVFDDDGEDFSDM